jgi:hypothetical protein
MQDVYRHYGIPAKTPYVRVASGGGGVWQGGNWSAGTAQGGDRDWRADRDRYHRHREWEREHEMRRAMTTACIAVGTRAAAIRSAIRTETQTAIAMIIMTATIMTTNLTSAWADCTVPIDSN